MPPLIPSSRGFVADVRSASSDFTRASRRGIGILAFMLALVLLSAVLLSSLEDKSEDSLESVKSQPAATAPKYVWRVYVLNQSTFTHGPNGTAFNFDISDLPFDFESIRFGDYRLDTTHEERYYGGCGILANASGTPATITLTEMAGRLISTVPYSGQDLIVFSGEWKSASYPVASTSYYGTDMLVEDWRNGTWSPHNGVMIHHPANVAVTGCVFCLMVFEPDGGVMIPEFQYFALEAIVFLAVACLLRKSKGSH